MHIAYDNFLQDLLNRGEHIAYIVHCPWINKLAVKGHTMFYGEKDFSQSETSKATKTQLLCKGIQNGRKH